MELDSWSYKKRITKKKKQKNSKTIKCTSTFTSTNSVTSSAVWVLYRFEIRHSFLRYRISPIWRLCISILGLETLNIRINTKYNCHPLHYFNLLKSLVTNKMHSKPVSFLGLHKNICCGRIDVKPSLVSLVETSVHPLI